MFKYVLGKTQFGSLIHVSEIMTSPAILLRVTDYINNVLGFYQTLTKMEN